MQSRLAVLNIDNGQLLPSNAGPGLEAIVAVNFHSPKHRLRGKLIAAPRDTRTTPPKAARLSVTAAKGAEELSAMTGVTVNY